LASYVVAEITEWLSMDIDGDDEDDEADASDLTSSNNEKAASEPDVKQEVAIEEA
jgi:hypothetical protein